MRTPNTEALALRATEACLKASTSKDPVLRGKATAAEIRLLEEHLKDAGSDDARRIRAQIEHLETQGRRY